VPKVLVTGNVIVCVSVPVKNWKYVLVLVRVVVAPAVAVLVNSVKFVRAALEVVAPVPPEATGKAVENVTAPETPSVPVMSSVFVGATTEPMRVSPRNTLSAVPSA
jgi:hypothetical protein